MELNQSEILHYLGINQTISDEMRLHISAISTNLTSRIHPRYTYKVFPLLHQDSQIFIQNTGILLTDTLSQKMLAQCDQIILLACTLGSVFDTMLRTEQTRNMADAVILNACGSTLVEFGCDAAETEIKSRFPNHFLTDRFSPGYGDLPLTLQPAICTALDSIRRIGLYVTDSCLLNPSKSVTALIGLSEKPQMARIRGCDYCSMRETCMLRKGGKRCAT